MTSPVAPRRVGKGGPGLPLDHESVLKWPQMEWEQFRTRYADEIQHAIGDRRLRRDPVCEIGSTIGILTRNISFFYAALLCHFRSRRFARHRRIGHLFRGRSKALPVEPGGFFLECSRYSRSLCQRRRLEIFALGAPDPFPEALPRLKDQWEATARPSLKEEADRYLAGHR